VTPVGAAQHPGNAVRCAPLLVDPDDAIGGGRPTGCSPKIGMQRIGIVDAMSGRFPGEHVKAVAADDEEIIDGDAIARGGIDRLPVSATCVPQARVRHPALTRPCIAEAFRYLQDPRPLRIEPLLLQHVLDLFFRQRDRHQLIAEPAGWRNRSA